MIGVFDSGIGGLTVLKALKETLPQASYLYLGDMARLPYGTKGEDVVVSYSLHAAQALVDRGIEALVAACNTVASCALPALQQAFPHIPVLGVVRPTVEYAVKLSQAHSYLVLATEATARTQLYASLIHELKPEAEIYTLPTSLLVNVAEEGWTDDAMVHTILRRYLKQHFGESAPSKIDCVILGCTHFPIFRESIQRFFGPNVHIVDSAYPTALQLKSWYQPTVTLKKEDHYMVTDLPQRFCQTAQVFMQATIPGHAVELINLG